MVCQSPGRRQTIETTGVGAVKWMKKKNEERKEKGNVLAVRKEKQEMLFIKTKTC